MATLYRKYRPQNFKEVVGQNHIKVTLEHEISSGKIAHAYLFCGPRAVGKTTLARVFAKAVNCPKRKESDSDPCNECDTCAEITVGRSLDINEIDAASHTGVDNVRENIIANAQVAPSKEKYKVFIIDEVHMLSISAFNALLKILEEPPENVIFILCTTEVHKVPTTIISRCQRFDFKRISVTDIVKKLQYITSKEGIKIDKKILEAISRQSEGHMRDAESLLGQVVSIGGKEITKEEADLVIPRSDLGEAVNLIEYLSKKDAGSAIELINKIIDEGINLKSFLTDLIELLRKIMLSKINPVLGERLGLELGENIEAKINQISKNLSLNQVVLFTDKFIEARNNLKGAFIIQLPVEIIIAELCTQPSMLNTQIPQNSVPNRVSSNLNQAKRPINTNSISTTKPAATGNSVENISKELILEKWNEVLVKVKKHNHSLSFILRVCQPRDINGNQLCLAFKYKFHKDRIGDINIKRLVEQVLNEVYNVPLIIEAIVDESIEVSNGNLNGQNGNGNLAQNRESKLSPGEIKKDEKDNNGNDMISNLIDTFGGKVRE